MCSERLLLLQALSSVVAMVVQPQFLILVFTVYMTRYWPSLWDVHCETSSFNSTGVRARMLQSLPKGRELTSRQNTLAVPGYPSGGLLMMVIMSLIHQTQMDLNGRLVRHGPSLRKLLVVAPLQLLLLQVQQVHPTSQPHLRTIQVVQ